jgi:hypothetical protein
MGKKKSSHQDGNGKSHSSPKDADKNSVHGKGRVIVPSFCFEKFL